LQLPSGHWIEIADSAIAAQQGFKVNVALEAVGQSLEQPISLVGVVLLQFWQDLEATTPPQFIQPTAPPGAAFEDAMEVGARHYPALGRGSPPTQILIIAEQGLRFGATVFQPAAAAMVQFEALQFKGWPGWPAHPHLPPGELFSAAETGLDGK
jgi:hypothetical protein